MHICNHIDFVPCYKTETDSVRALSSKSEMFALTHEVWIYIYLNINIKYIIYCSWLRNNIYLTRKSPLFLTTFIYHFCELICLFNIKHGGKVLWSTSTLFVHLVIKSAKLLLCMIFTWMKRVTKYNSTMCNRLPDDTNSLWLHKSRWEAATIVVRFFLKGKYGIENCIKSDNYLTSLVSNSVNNSV